MRVVKAAFIGLGSVNLNLLKILSDKKKRLADEYGISFKITLIMDSSGVAISEEGFEPAQVINHKKSGKAVATMHGYCGTDIVDSLKEHDCDLIFEASPVDLETGGIALLISKYALSKGISVVLANKGPVVLGYKELSELAVANGAGFKYSATVCGGLPVLNIGRRDMIAADISKISGVFNGTSNFIFDALKNGDSFEQAIIEAQNVGAAEADPSLDTGGWDTAFKLLIIANHMLGANISLSDIDVTGIEDITPKMITAENDLGNTIKLVARIEDGQYTVKPEVIEKESFLGSIDGWEMGVEIHSDIYGISYHKLYEKEPIPTAASMMRDAVNIFI